MMKLLVSTEHKTKVGKINERKEDDTEHDIFLRN